ncbi:integrase [Agrobacterium tumefaciens]|nr:integrase [Agrobacterium tumefaciens]
MLVTGIQPTRVCATEEFFQPKDLGWLDSCDKHRNEDGENVISVSGQTTHIWA